MTRQTLFLIFTLVAVVTILSFLAILQSLEQTNQQKMAQPNKTAAPIDPALIPNTIISASPSASLLGAGETQVIDILIETGSNNLSTIQLEIGFDPEFLDVQKVEPGTFLENPTVLFEEIDSKSGRISLALGALTPKKGKGTLATITALAKKPTVKTGATSLTFLPKTQVLGSSNQNLDSLIRETRGSQITITSAVLNTESQ